MAICLVVQGLSGEAQEAAQVEAGVAVRELVPPRRVPLAGYSRRRGRVAQGVHDAPKVRALVLRQGEQLTALVSCDLLIIDELLYQAVAERLDGAMPDQPPRLLLAATHTHSGPGAYGRKFLEKLSMGHFDPVVFEFLASQIASAVLDAARQRQPVRVAYHTVQTQGLVRNRIPREDVVDPELRVVTLHVDGGDPLAIIVNFAAHPTTLGAWNRELSADYPGVVAREVEQRFPTTVCLFAVGALGDQAPVKHGKGFEASERLGQALAEQAIALVNASAGEPARSLHAIEAVVPLPPARVRVGSFWLPRWLATRLVDDDATVSLLAVNEIVLLGFPCDLSAELGGGLTAYAKAQGRKPVIVSLANDYIGYCLPERLYGTDTYEAQLAFNGPKTGTLLVETAKQMIDQLSDEWRVANGE